MNKPQKVRNDGKALERALHQIQQSILQNDPSFQQGDFTVELNKKIRLNGTLHEVDVYVVTKPGTSYESKIFFECKDWKTPVSKNVVMNLKEKVDLLGATRGIIVGKSISKDALALLESYPRIEYRRFTEDISAMLGVSIVHTIHDPLGSQARISFYNPPVQPIENPKYEICEHGLRVAPFLILVGEWTDELVKRDKQLNQKKYDSEGVHWYEIHDYREFLPGEFQLRGHDVSFLELHCCYFVKVGIASPSYRCSIDGEGQIQKFQLAHEDFPDRDLSVEVIFAENRATKSQLK